MVTVPNKQLAEDAKELLSVGTCKPVNTPVTKARSYWAEDQGRLDEAAHNVYRPAVGKLLFMAQDRADVKYATNECARDLAERAELSTRKVTCIVKYVVCTLDHGTGIQKDHGA